MFSQVGIVPSEIVHGIFVPTLNKQNIHQVGTPTLFHTHTHSLTPSCPTHDHHLSYILLRLFGLSYSCRVCSLNRDGVYDDGRITLLFFYL